VVRTLLLINAADRFKSPLRHEDDITEHDHIEELVAETVDIFLEIIGKSLEKR
jgi:hypothetical protein